MGGGHHKRPQCKPHATKYAGQGTQARSGTPPRACDWYATWAPWCDPWYIRRGTTDTEARFQPGLPTDLRRRGCIEQPRPVVSRAGRHLLLLSDSGSCQESVKHRAATSRIQAKARNVPGAFRHAPDKTSAAETPGSPEPRGEPGDEPESVPMSVSSAVWAALGSNCGGSWQETSPAMRPSVGPGLDASPMRAARRPHAAAVRQVRVTIGRGHGTPPAPASRIRPARGEACEACVLGTHGVYPR